MDQKLLKEKNLFPLVEDKKKNQYYYSTGKFMVINRDILNIDDDFKKREYLMTEPKVFERIKKEIEEIKKGKQDDKK